MAMVSPISLAALASLFALPKMLLSLLLRLLLPLGAAVSRARGADNTEAYTTGFSSDDISETRIIITAEAKPNIILCPVVLGTRE